MHTLGKVFTWLTVALAIGAIVLSLRLLDVRNSWTQQVETVDNDHTSLKEENQQLAADIAEQRRRLRNLRSELHRTVLIWGRFWNAEARPLDAGEGRLRAAVGTNQGLRPPGEETVTTLHAFRPTADGNYVYVGEFEATTVRENESRLDATWRIRPGEAQNWQGGTWRFREAIPPGYQTRFVDLRTELTVADELFAAKQDYLQAQEELIRSANEHLQYRRQELIGDPNDPEDKGLNGEISDEEDARNQALAEVDQLRHNREDALQRIDELIGANRRLAERLPGSEPEPDGEVSAAAAK